MFSKGLKGIVATETKISHIDGREGELNYRGIPINELAMNYSFEEVAYFLWYGEMPKELELNEMKQKLKVYRILPNYLKDIIKLLPEEMDLMSVLRSVVSSIELNEKQEMPTIDQSMQITALIPTIIAYAYRCKNNLEPINPSESYDHVKNYLFMLSGEEPLDDHVVALETYMILTMEHGMNASTFSARVTISTQSDILSGVTSAIGTMKGPLHGGAPSGVIELLDEIGEKERAETVIRNKIRAGERLMGFGHRVYKTFDPRAEAIKSKLLKANLSDSWLKLALYVEDIAIKALDDLKPGRDLKTNVEYYAAAIMRAFRMEPELFTPTFSASRIIGWTAHILEQMENNTIFRPEAIYIGKV